MAKSNELKRSAERHALILSTVTAQQYATIATLAEVCGTSEQTIRRDLATLADEGKLVRYHGGARLPQPETESATYERRHSRNASAKAKACELLLDLIPDGATLFLSGGSTLVTAAQVLLKRERLTIVTNNLHAAVVLYDRADITTFVVGGFLRTASGSLVGEDAVKALERFSLDFAVVSAAGLSDQGDLLEYDEAVSAPMRVMLQNARERILVLDSSKFCEKGIIRANHLRQVGHVLTDSQPPPSVVAMIERFGGNLRVASRTYATQAEETLDAL